MMMFSLLAVLYSSLETGRQPALGGEAADAGRKGGVFAAEFAAGAEKLIGRLAAGSGGSVTKPERSKAIRSMAMLVGAVVVARAIGQGDLREEIIAACKEHLR